MAVINIFLTSLIILEAIVFSLTGSGIPGTDDVIFTGLNVLMGVSYLIIILLHGKISEGVKLSSIS
jgi:ABC-type microcin C transport system permease subunit YejB